MKITTYDVDEANAFPKPQVPPNSLIFRNGLLQTENDDYDLVDGRLHIVDPPLDVRGHERITVVEIG